MTDDERPDLGEPEGMVSIRMMASMSGAIPIVGPVIQAAFAEIIPNVRIQRIEAYLRCLEQRLDEVTLPARLRDEQGLELFEEGIWQSARAASEDRKQRIAYLVIKEFADQDEDMATARHWLRLFGQFGDEDIALLLDEYAWSAMRPNDEGGARERGKNYSNITRSRQLLLYSLGLLVRVPTMDGGGFINGVTRPGEDFLRYMGLIDQADTTDGG